MPALLWADDQGRILDHPHLEMAGFLGREAARPDEGGLIPLPEFSKLFYLPGCPPIGYDRRTGKYVRVETVRLGRKNFTAQAVAAFMAPGWVRTLLPAADYSKKDVILPMWGYTAVGFDERGYVVPAFKIENNPSWDPANFDDEEVVPALETRLAERPDNRLYAHLAECAVINHCFAAKNLFLGRWEAPLPVSRSCNAACLGCISLQPPDGPRAPHHRIEFTPSAAEVTQVALDHLARAPDGIVSFGQGCEGDPLTETALIRDSIAAIRAATGAGTINLNTNGSRPEAVAELAAAGLDSIRVSLVSPRPEIFTAYVRPRGFGLAEVEKSLITAREAGVFTMINYLVFPGVSDQEAEIEALLDFLRRTGVMFVHLKNLCIDPDFYLNHIPLADSPAVGLARLAQILESEIDGLRLGYFNQPARQAAPAVDPGSSPGGKSGNSDNSA